MRGITLFPGLWTIFKYFYTIIGIVWEFEMKCRERRYSIYTQDKGHSASQNRQKVRELQQRRQIVNELENYLRNGNYQGALEILKCTPQLAASERAVKYWLKLQEEDVVSLDDLCSLLAKNLLSYIGYEVKFPDNGRTDAVLQKVTHGIPRWPMMTTWQDLLLALLTKA